MRTDRWRIGLAALFTISGTAHFIAPTPFAGIVPPFLGPPLPYVAVSGAAELACALGLVARPPRVRQVAAWASAALLVAVFPANVYMAVAAFSQQHGIGYRAATVARLPLQVPLIRAAVAIWQVERAKAAALRPGAERVSRRP